MGQIEDRQNNSTHDRGSRAQRQKIRLYVGALGLALVAISGLAIARSHQEQTSQQKPASRFAFDQDKAWASLVKQCDFGPRVPGTEAQIKCRDYILEETKKWCENAHTQEFTHKWSQTGQELHMWNVIGEQNWKDAKTRVLLVAHWDSRPFSDQDPDRANLRKPIIGADDGASGVAVMLELMRVMKEKKPDVGIMYFFTDGEDLGPDSDEMYLGAEYFVKNMPTPKPTYGILLDMVGDKDLHIPMERNSLSLAPSLTQAFYSHAKFEGFGDTFPNVYGDTIEDDHLCINQAGVPTLDLIDFEYAPWHTQGDTPDKCSAASLGKIGQCLESWLLKKPAFTIRGK